MLCLLEPKMSTGSFNPLISQYCSVILTSFHIWPYFSLCTWSAISNFIASPQTSALFYSFQTLNLEGGCFYATYHTCIECRTYSSWLYFHFVMAWLWWDVSKGCDSFLTLSWCCINCRLDIKLPPAALDIQYFSNCSCSVKQTGLPQHIKTRVNLMLCTKK